MRKPRRQASPRKPYDREYHAKVRAPREKAARAARRNSLEEVLRRALKVIEQAELGAAKLLKRQARDAERAARSVDGLSQRQRKRLARKAAEKRATPRWVDKAQLADIYAKAALIGSTWVHVDHIVPLRGRGVCGLHVPWNLQILDKWGNLYKGNSHG